MGTDTAGNAAVTVGLSGQENTTEADSEAKEVLAQESTIATPEAKEKPPESGSYVTEERLKTILAETLEQGKRLGQSQTDKYVRKVEGQNKGLTTRLTTLTNRLREVDPDGAKELELADYKARESETAMQAEQQRVADEFFGEFLADAKERGIDPDDKRIDWGSDATSIAAQARRINASFRKIEKEDAGKKAKPKSANSVDTKINTGGKSSVIPRDMLSFRKWVSELSSEEFKKREKEIDEALQKGLVT